MSNQIIRQPDGNYAIWSTVVDHFTAIDMTLDDIVEMWAAEERSRIAKKVFEIVTQLENGGKPYHQFTRTWDDAIGFIKAVHGETATLESLRKEG